MPPTLTNGKLCYLEIPATDIAVSAAFYRRVFGWNVRQRDRLRRHDWRGQRVLGAG